MTPRLSIVTMRPHYGREQNVASLLAQYVLSLRALGLATDRELVLARADTGELVAVFEWTSGDAIGVAEASPSILRVMRAIAANADFLVTADIPAARELFFELTPLDRPNTGDSTDTSLWRAANVTLPDTRTSSEPVPRQLRS